MKNSKKKISEQDNIETGYEPTGHAHKEKQDISEHFVHFAGLAMQALITRNNTSGTRQLCRDAFVYANNMMGELEISYAEYNKKS